MSRYEDRNEYVVDVSDREELLKQRGVKSLRFYSTPEFEKLTANDYAEIHEIRHVWKIGDRYYKLADKYYGDTQYWWVIAKYNERPTESHISLGEVISIPQPLEVMVELYRR